VRSEPVRVAVDLETTGLRPDQDAIIEIGAVKFAGPRILDIYQSFVNISGPLPFRIQRLTGIVPADLRRAPALASLLPSLRAFLGDAPLVGHSVSFDAAFLRRSGVAQRNPLIDTYEMASMLLPNLPSYTLGAVAVALDAPSSTHHRALADADLARAVFLALLDRLRDLDTHALDELAALPAPADWTPGFLVHAQARERREVVSASPFAALLEGAGANTFTARGLDPALGSMAIALEEPPAPEPAPPRATPSAEAATRPARLSALRELLTDGGALLYEIERKEEALIEALAEVVRWVAAGGERVIVATADREEMTRVARDLLPRAAAHAGIDPAPRIAELDERAAYLCLHRWFGVARDPLAGGFPMEVTRGLARLTVWARETGNGLRADVSLHGAEEAAWERVRSGAEFGETVEGCPYRAEGYCFAARAESRTLEAGVIVTTHAALAASLAGADMALPDAPRVIALDGRLLEDELRRARTLTLDPLILLALLDDLAAEAGESQPHDLLRVAGSLLWPDKPERKPSAPPRIATEEQAWRTAVGQARVCAREFFTALRQALREGQEDQARGGRGRGEQRDGGAVRVDDELRDSHAWTRVTASWARLAGGLTETSAAARAAARALETARPPTSAEAARGARTDLLGAARRLDTLRAHGATLLAPDDDRAITWIRAPYAPFPDQNHDRRAQRDTTAAEPTEAREALLDENGAESSVVKEAIPAMQLPDEILDAPSLISIPTRVGALTGPLWRDGRGLALLGWALSVGGDFEPTRVALGLPESTRQASLTPDYHQQTLLCLPDDVAEPNAPGAQSQLEGLIVALARALDGDVVAIFPSHAMLRASAASVRRALERHNILALAQGVDGSARQLWQTFETQERTVLLGAGSFWDGAERRARPPACVVVARTPFPAQSDPVTATRAEAWSDPQSQFITPQAALKLRQALGGLAWSHSRRNAVILFDRRLQTRGYGPTILSALPECEQYQGPLSALPDRIARWTGATD
jgi:Rad3-related DNA helicase/DNA polymerase III epsilon subunit-like protein